MTASDAPPPPPLWTGAPPAGPLPEGRSCGDCVWRSAAEGTCLRHQGAAVAPLAPACPAFTADLDCQACGACCREGFDCVELSPDEPFARDHAALLITAWGQLQLPRPGGRCRCLDGQAGAWSCRLYAERPESCRAFPVGEESCLVARRRVGLTP